MSTTGNINNSQVGKDALAALTDEWKSAREIHRAVGVWSERSVAAVLLFFARAGRVDMMDVQIPSGTKHMFKRSGGPTSR